MVVCRNGQRISASGGWVFGGGRAPRLVDEKHGDMDQGVHCFSSCFRAFKSFCFCFCSCCCSLLPTGLLGAVGFAPSVHFAALCLADCLFECVGSGGGERGRGGSRPIGRRKHGCIYRCGSTGWTLSVGGLIGVFY